MKNQKNRTTPKDIKSKIRLKSSDLHTLIRSLTKAEKRHFSLMASLYNSGKNYHLLFDAIAEQEEYNEDAIKEKYQGETFIKNIHESKSYLFELILRSLRSIHHSKTGAIQMLNDLIDASVLSLKGLKDIAGSLTKRTLLKHSGYSGMLPYELVARNIYLSLWVDKQYNGISAMDLVKETDKLNERNRDYTNLSVVEAYNHKVFQNYYQGIKSKNKAKAILKESFQLPNKLTLEAEIIKWESNMVVAYQASDLTAFKKALNSYYNLLIKGEHLYDLNREFLYSAKIRNCGYSYMLINEYKKASDIFLANEEYQVKKITQGKSHFDEISLIHLKVDTLLCKIYYASKTTIQTTLSNIIFFYESNKTKIFDESKIRTATKLSIVAYIIGDYKLSNKYTHEVLRFSKANNDNESTWAQRFAILISITFFERGDLTYVESFIKKTRKKNSTTLSKTTQAIFDCLIQICKENKQPETHFKTLISKLNKLLLLQEQSETIKQLHLIEWANSKLSKTSLLEEIQKTVK